MEETPRAKVDLRRRRPALACVSCRKSKIRCDRQHPCGACVRSRHKTCVFEPVRRPTSRRSGITSTPADPSETAEAERRTTLGPVTPVSSTHTAHDYDHDLDHVSSLREPDTVNTSAPVVNVHVVWERLFQLERRLDESAATREQPPERNEPPKNEPRSSRFEGQVIESYLAADIHAMSRGVVSKTRYFGQSHWMNGIIHFKSMLELFEHQSKDAKSEAMAVLNRCKTLARTIKAQRNPDIIGKLGTNIPTREIADKLVDGYLRSTETVFRVLHVPSFKRDYEQYWTAPETASLAFVIQLQLVMAIGCTVYDEFFSMRNSAVQWVTEAQYWLLGPPAKGKLTIIGLQNMILLTIGRETASVGGDLVWIHVGSLLRSAFYMGLHRDPSRLPKMSRLDAEIRRRLWNTILELELKTSIDAGGFPMISPETSDTQAPANLDDADLTRDDEPKDDETGERFTDMSVALALRGSFYERLAIYRMLNAIPFRGTYEDTIQLHRRFMPVFRAVMKQLKSYPSSERQPTSFQCRFVEIMNRRCVMSLHLPYLGPGLKDPAFSFSRREVVETAVKMYRLLFPPAANPDPSLPLVNMGDELEIISTDGDDPARFGVCASGFWRLIASQPSMIVTLELQTTLQDEDGLGPPTPRTDLTNILRHSLPYYLTRIKAGETNVKGYLFTTALAGHVQALLDGLSGPKIIEPVLSAAIKTEKVCFDLLKQQLVPTEDANADGPDQFDWNALMTEEEDWSHNPMMRPFFEVSSVDSFLGPNLGFDFYSPPMPF
ncbi:hypothetical protein F4678DRAFT_254276 [Xylaria arbuscula]|nr:hypothetical protein F4678DRAFT_254276 [Xylaria arbuscula]